MCYEEKQGFAAWVYLLLVLVMAGSVAAIIIAILMDEGNPTAAIILLAHLPLMLLIFDVLFLCTRIQSGELLIQLGWPVPVYRKRIPVSDIRTLREVTYRPIRDAGGWGIRFGRFEGKRCRFLNAKGNRGVLVETGSLRLIIGSGEPERLAAALRDVGAGSE